MAMLAVAGGDEAQIDLNPNSLFSPYLSEARMSQNHFCSGSLLTTVYGGPINGLSSQKGLPATLSHSLSLGPMSSALLVWAKIVGGWVDKQWEN